jgi:hypothetical protein
MAHSSSSEPLTFKKGRIMRSGLFLFHGQRGVLDGNNQCQASRNTWLRSSCARFMAARALLSTLASIIVLLLAIHFRDIELSFM